MRLLQSPTQIFFVLKPSAEAGCVIRARQRLCARWPGTRVRPAFVFTRVARLLLFTLRAI